MSEFPAWIQALAAIAVPAIGYLVAWARSQAGKTATLELENANLKGRVSALEAARTEDLKAIERIASGQTEILVKLEGVLTELRLTRKGDA